MVLAGWGRTISLFQKFDQFPFEATAKPVTVQAIVVDKLASDSSLMKHMCTLRLTSINQKNLPIQYFIQMYTQNPLNTEIGDTIELQKICINKVKNEKFNKYLHKENIATTLFQKKCDMVVIERPFFSFSRWIYHQKNRIYASFKNKLSKKTFLFFAYLFLGKKEASKSSLETVKRKFKQWGILHFLARSGLHLVIIIAVYEMFLRFIPISLMYKNLILIFFNIIYLLFSWSSISFLRAFIIFMLYKIYSLFYVPVHFLHLLILTCIMILLVNPLQLFHIDFQLSFGLTAALGWLNQYTTYQKIH